MTEGVLVISGFIKSPNSTNGAKKPTSDNILGKSPNPVIDSIFICSYTDAQGSGEEAV